MLDFFAKNFAIAGAICALGPIIIHLLNRRRFRVVQWAAMDFLKHALQRNRRILRLRDIILLVLRCLVVLCIGMALARPFLTTAGSGALARSAWPWLVTAVALGTAIAAVLSQERLTRWLTGVVAIAATVFAGWGLWNLYQTSNRGEVIAQSSQAPVHAVLLLDNSLSMGYETLGGTLLDRARTRAEEYVDALPAGSRVSVIPFCGQPGTFNLDGYRTKEDTRDALQRIQVADRAGLVTAALSLAQQACEQVPELPTKRVVMLSDQQATAWPTGKLDAELAKLPELQVVEVAADRHENVWIENFRVQNDIADIETPATFLADVRYHGEKPLSGVQVSLSVDGTSVASRSIDLEPDQSRQVEFQYQIDVPNTLQPLTAGDENAASLAAGDENGMAGLPQYVTAELSVQTAATGGDRLSRDNQRFLVVPVVAGLPVVFVDQLGADRENARDGIVGETYALRRLLAPRADRESFKRELIDVKHVTIDEVDRELLANARMVVIAGVESPGDAVDVLREFVLQGGPLVIAAGSDFDPAAWTDLAWRNGAGILPVPLAATPVGETPEYLDRRDQLADLKVFRMDFATMEHPYFVIENAKREFLADWYRITLFFKAVLAEHSPAVLEQLKQTETKRLTTEREWLVEAVNRRKKWEQMRKAGTLGPTEESLEAEDKSRLRQLQPGWLLWRTDTESESLETPIEELVSRSLPRVLARFTGNAAKAGTGTNTVENSGDAAERQLPFLVERNIGRGKVLLFTSGVSSAWNTLSGKNDNIALFDRILRDLIEDTLPDREFSAGQRVVLPVSPDQRREYRLQTPDGMQRPLAVEALTADQFGLVLQEMEQAGSYRLISGWADEAALTADGTPRPTGNLPMAVNGPVRESDPVALTEATLEERIGPPTEAAQWRWVANDESIPLEGATIQGGDWWKILVLLALIGLLGEMLVLSWPAIVSRFSSQSATNTGTTTGAAGGTPARTEAA